MDSTAFAYWLQGFAELHGQPPTPAQWDSIKEHLGLVFHKVTKVDPLSITGCGIGVGSSPSLLNEVTMRILDTVVEGTVCGPYPFQGNWPMPNETPIICVTC